jgi:hypothetical protein
MGKSVLGKPTMTIHIIILYVACFGLLVSQFFAFRHEMKLEERIMNLEDRVGYLEAEVL